MLRRLSVALALCLLSMTGSVQALGLGTIKVGSALNQRFSAVIPFTSLSPEEAANVRARIADNQDFSRAGMDRSAVMSSVQVEVIADGPNPRLVLRSTEIMREPLVNLLIEVRTAGGGPRILRQFTVLLDPPSATAAAPDNAPAATAPANSSSSGEFFFQTPEESTTAPAVVRAPRTAAPAPRAQPVDEDGRYGPVRAGETLASIAQSVRPDGVSVEQATLGLFEANRGAFLDGNINRLRRGATLDVPSAEQLRAVSTSAARTRIQALSAPSTTAPAAVTAPAPSASETAPAPAAPSAAVTPAPAVSAPDAAVDAPAEATAPTEAATQAPADAAATTDAAPGAESAATTEGAAPAVDTLTEAPAEAEAAAEAPAAPEATVEDLAAPAASEPEQGDWISRFLLPGLIALIVLLIGFAAWRTARERKAQREYEAAALQPASMPAPRPGATGSVSAKSATTARDELEALNRRIEDEDATRVQAAAAADDDATRVTSPESAEQARMVTTSRIPPYTGPQATDRTLSADEQAVSTKFEQNTTAINLGENDPIAESEFHLAYGLYEEAALLLQQASAREPGRTDLRVKLAETYFAAGKAKEFEQTAATLKGQVAGEEWNKIAIMGRQVAPGAAMFAGAGSEVADTALDLSLDDDATQITPVKVDEGLEFNLEELELPTQTPATKSSPASNVIEFDLGEFDLGEAEKSKPAVSAADIDLKEFDLGSGTTPPTLELGEIDPRVIDDPLSDEALAAGDDAATKLDLARAYVEMGDSEMARSLLDEVAQVGNDDQKREAGELRSRLLG